MIQTKDEIQEHANKVNHLIDAAKVLLGLVLPPKGAESLLPHFDKRCASGLDYGTAFHLAYGGWVSDQEGVGSDKE